MSGYGNYYQPGAPAGGYGGNYSTGNFGSAGYSSSAYGAGGQGFGYGTGAGAANYGTPSNGSFGYGGATGGTPYAQMGAAAYGGANYGGQSAYGYASRGAAGYMGTGCGNGGYRNNTPSVGGGAGGGGISQERQQRSVFVGNIPYKATEGELIQIFSQAGSVVAFRLVSDRDTGRPKGFGFCEYADATSAATALEMLNGTELHGRSLRVGSSK